MPREISKVLLAGSTVSASPVSRHNQHGEKRTWVLLKKHIQNKFSWNLEFPKHGWGKSHEKKLSSSSPPGSDCCRLHDSHCAEHASYSSVLGNPSTSGSFEMNQLIPRKYLLISCTNVMLIARSVGLFPLQDDKNPSWIYQCYGGSFMSFWSWMPPFSPTSASGLLPLPLPFRLLLMQWTHLETLKVVPNTRDTFCWYL